MADCKENTEEASDPQPPVTMKFDAPEEPRENSTNDETEEQSRENNAQNSISPAVLSPNKIPHPVLAASTIENSEYIPNRINFMKSRFDAVLRPSLLTTITFGPGASNKTVLQPAKFNNPFTKVSDSVTVNDNKPVVENDKNNDEKKETESETKPSEVVKPKFLPLGAADSAKEIENSINSTVAPSVSAAKFVFGQNLKERVAVSEDTGSSGSLEKEDKKPEETNENGSSELLFSNAAAICRTPSKPSLTLTQAAQELEEANRANKRKYSEVTLLTGEEGETNVLQINCKLFAFDKATSGWQERGRGSLRLNDRDEESRLVGRTAGTQRLILNTKVWPGMTAERAGPKSLRLTAMDVHGDIRIFVVQAAPKEVDQLHYLLMQRLKRAQERQPKKLATDH